MSITRHSYHFGSHAPYFIVAMRFIPHSAMSLMVYSSVGFIPHSAMRFMAYISMGFIPHSVMPLWFIASLVLRFIPHSAMRFMVYSGFANLWLRTCARSSRRLAGAHQRGRAGSRARTLVGAKSDAVSRTGKHSRATDVIIRECGSGSELSRNLSSA